MKRYETGETATYGIYIARNMFDVRFVGADGEALEGRKGGSYMRLPTWLVVAVGPALGGMFVMAFPLLVIATIFGTLGVGLFRKLGGQRHAYVARSGWQPAAAYFKHDQTEGGGEGAGDPEMAQLETEVAERAEAEKQG
ncbi:MAG: hypothetical protein EP329_17805 [Deltaproteobacteria bacterium]|nr:MAG: hypothetical protein EP329_17805 [Deltaproteobacteria bacterium]